MKIKEAVASRACHLQYNLAPAFSLKLGLVGAQILCKLTMIISQNF
jgi:hypothetical protein